RRQHRSRHSRFPRQGGIVGGSETDGVDVGGRISPRSGGGLSRLVADAAQYSSRRADRGPPAGRSTPSAGQGFRRRHTKYSQTVYEIHGNFRTGRCVDCRAAYEMAAFYDRIERGEIELPLCSECRSPIKPDVVLFGDLLPFDVWDRAVEASRGCDLMLVLGSSLIVYPAAELPKLAVMNGAKLIIVNREVTDYDPMASVV